MKTILLDGLWGAAWRLHGLRRSLQRRGFEEVEIFRYNSSGLVPLEELADQLREFAGEGPVRVVAHSMGGIITRLAKARDPGWELRRVAFLCVPHQGSTLARLLPWAGIRQLRPDSDIIQMLARQDWTIPTLCVWCPGDLIVFPGSSARWPSAEVELPCLFPLHNWPVVSPFFHYRIADFFQHSEHTATS
jgi:triacylglycerol lipase